ncbi:hypothetical protein BVX94_00095 [bacterium B17]|nr:hypothetical protein BVX94_00095 [bacterium B17]
MSRIINLKNDVAKYVGITLERVESLAAVAPKSYRRDEGSKRSGRGSRVIFHPSKKTKALQYGLIKILLDDLPVHASAYAYRKGLKAPLLKNSMLHQKYSFSIRIDFKDFFPSIVPEDLFKVIDESGLFPAALDSADKRFLENVLFIRHHGLMHLAIGAPSSPSISNAIMHSLDVLFSAFARDKDSVYSRYVDDIIFSTNRKGMCDEFLRFLSTTLSGTPSPILQVNATKTLVMSRGTRRCVTGMFITPEGGVSIGRTRKRKLRTLLYRYSKHLKGEDVLSKEDLNYLKGNLAFVLDVEPDYYNRLVQKYTATMVNSALHASVS